MMPSEDKQGFNIDEEDDMNERIDHIKESLVATIIMHATRELEPDMRRDLK
jgi:hypothetical protein